MKKAIVVKRNTVVDIIAALLLVFFVHSSISNFINIQSLKNLLAFYTAHRNEVAWLIVLSEAFVVLLLFIPRTRILGFVAVATLAIGAGFVVLNYPDNPHHFGGIVNKFSDKQQIFFYSLLLVISVSGVSMILLHRKKTAETNSNPVVFT